MVDWALEEKKKISLSIRDRPEKPVMVDWALDTIYLSIHPYMVALRKASWLNGRWAVVCLSIHTWSP